MESWMPWTASPKFERTHGWGSTWKCQYRDLSSFRLLVWLSCLKGGKKKQIRPQPICTFQIEWYTFITTTFNIQHCSEAENQLRQYGSVKSWNFFYIFISLISHMAITVMEYLTWIIHSVDVFTYKDIFIDK